VIGVRQDGVSVIENAGENRHRVFSNSRNDGASGAERLRDVQRGLFHNPKFKLDKNRPVFTIGSCFARNIEAHLERRDIHCVTSEAIYPASYYALQSGADRNGALNAYTPASMLSVLQLPDRSDAMSAGVIDLGGGVFSDMMLHGLRELSEDELQECRSRLIGTYAKLNTAGTVIITLGFTESWYQVSDDLYVNKPPVGGKRYRRHAADFQFQNLSASQVVNILEGIVAEIFSKCDAETKIIITVSPVPLGRTFSHSDVILANDYSKATLLSAALEVIGRHGRVDYFPSYQYVAYRDRESAFIADGTHVRPEVVGEVVGSFIDSYFG
jgi:hypothetical protein